MDPFDFMVYELLILQDNEQAKLENNQEIAESFVERVLLRGYKIGNQ